MKLRVLGSSGAELPDHNLPAFLIDDSILLDAGTIGLSLDDRQQWLIKHILVTHAHLDHIKGIPFLLDNIIVKNRKHSVTVMSGRDVIRDLRKNVLNDRIWPDFSKIPSEKAPTVKFRTLRPGSAVALNGYSVVCEKVSHSVPAFGYIVTNKKGRSIAYTGDTGPTDRFWKTVEKYDVRCLIAEVSFPNRMEELAVKAGHLTASLLRKELAKMSTLPQRIYATHTKPQYMKAIEREISRLRIENISILRDNQRITVI